ncbi:MAG TPA: ATP-binding cassette domain-containing protein [Candidatus Blautia intestinigallinarum]|nr:ATP-binding cassette domain-containing protein [Candidatus Blautia intestinigallinarum]
MKEIVIFTDRLTKTFSRKEVIRDCQISVERGTIYGLLGKNGAGKTTIFKLLLGFLKPTAGTAAIFNMDSVKDNAKILRHTGSLIETPVFYEHLSAADNLLLHLAYMGIENRKVESVLERVGLPGTGTQPVREFSLGMRQRLAIARAIIHRPEVLILDEPVNGLDPAGIREMRILFRQLADQDGVTILLSSHLLSEVRQITDRIGVIADGRLVLEANTEEIRKKHPKDMEDYLIGVMEGGLHYA